MYLDWNKATVPTAGLSRIVKREFEATHRLAPCQVKKVLQANYHLTSKYKVAAKRLNPDDSKTISNGIRPTFDVIAIVKSTVTIGMPFTITKDAEVLPPFPLKKLSY